MEQAFPKAMKLSFFAIIFMMLLPEALAQGHGLDEEHHLTLLAVSDNADKGITADMFVRISPGSGNVFIEADPVTKLDTRISTKLAKEISCERVESLSAKCDQYDYFFRIEANASLIGGPSAGAAAAALAMAAIDDARINQSVAVTGTINSGGIIGQVGGLREKIMAASEKGISTVLIPMGERHIRVPNRTSTVDLVDYGNGLGVKVIEVADISEVLFYLTGRNYSVGRQDIQIDRSYSQIMHGLAQNICERSDELSGMVDKPFVARSGKAETVILEAAKNLSFEGSQEIKRGNYYSGASLCFGANVRHHYLSILDDNLSSGDALAQVNSTQAEIGQFEESIPEAGTLSGLQVRGIVKDRLAEAQVLLDNAGTELGKGNYNDALYQLAFAMERLDSARAWNRFMSSMAGSDVQFYSDDSPELRNGCTLRIDEAEERIQYLGIYFPGAIKTTELAPIYANLRAADYSSCIFGASLSKAKANAMLSAISASSDLSGLVERKLEAVRESIVRQTGKGNFPIVSYSYYEYSNTLKSTDEPSALLFAEYALELSNLDIYVNGINPAAPAAKLESLPVAKGFGNFLFALAAGFVAGIATAGAILSLKRIAARRRKPVLLVKARKRKKS